MQLCNPKECSAWLADNSIRERPYELALLAETAYVQFAIYEPRRRGTEVLELLNKAIGLSSQSLLQLVDWSPHFEQTDAALLSLSTAFSESHMYGSGILFDPSEQDAVLSAASSVIDKLMSAYLYVPESATCFLWEGDMVDFWSPHIDTARELLSLLGVANMQVTSKAHT